MNETTPIAIPTENTISSAVSETATGISTSEIISETGVTAEQETDLSGSSLNETDITDISEESISDVSDVSVLEISVSEPITIMTEISETVTEAPTEIVTLPKETTAAETTAAIITETTAQATPLFSFESLNISPNVIIIAAIIIAAIIASVVLKKMDLNKDF